MTQPVRPISVLVADDSAALRALVRITLASEGWAVSEAETAEAALGLTRQMRPDLVVLDITFGETGPDGLAVCAELKADPATARVPILILTAHDDPAERRRAEAAGADAFVAKPFGPLDLMRVLRDLIPTPVAPALGVYLLDAGAVEPTALEEALVEQKELVDHGTPKRLGDVLVQRGVVSGAALDRALLEQMHARAMRSEGSRARVVIIDDHAAVREGLRSLIQSEETLEVVGEAADAGEGLRLARRHQPDVIVIDNEMPGASGVDLLPTLRGEVPSAKLVMFSLDEAVRETALAAGAHVFIAKDAPIGQILEALRPSHAIAPPPAATMPLPVVPRGHRLLRASLILAAALAAYALLFFVLETAVGAAAAVISVLPVIVVGVLLGPEGGLAAAVLTILATAALWGVTGHAVGEPIVEIGGQGFGIVMLLLLGFGAGAMRVLGLRLDPRGRRAEAIAEAARALSGLDRGEFIDVFLDAMLRVVPGDLALLFSNAAGDARFIAASRPIGGGDADRIARLARDAMRTASARVIEEVAEGERPVSTLRSAALVPVSVAGQDVRGVLVVLHHERARYGPDDVSLIRPFAQYLWVVLRSGTPANEVASARERREAG